MYVFKGWIERFAYCSMETPLSSNTGSNISVHHSTCSVQRVKIRYPEVYQLCDNDNHKHN